jgi:hypothetical protein
MRRVAMAVVAVAMLAGISGSAQGFGTIRGAGQDAEHERITRKALGNLLDTWTLDELAGSNRHFGAVGAPDKPGRLLLTVERNHCDGADWLDVSGYPQTRDQARRKLQDCREYIFAKLRAAAEDAPALVKQLPDGRWAVDEDQMTVKDNDCSFLGVKGRAKCNVLEDLGLALHASQDFYSHSNWVDLPDPNQPIGPRNPPGLGNINPAPWLDPAAIATAEDPFPEGLITGCFTGKPESAFCNYGFWATPRVKHLALNKDGKNSPRSKIGDNFDRAFTAAALDTYGKWMWLESTMQREYPGSRGAKIVCALRHDSAASCN